MRLPRRDASRNDKHPHPALSPQGRGNEIAALSSKARNDRGMDSHFHGNDKSGGGNNTRDTE